MARPMPVTGGTGPPPRAGPGTQVQGAGPGTQVQGGAPPHQSPSDGGGGSASARDPLTANGLSSALCRRPGANLSPRTRADCEASGLSASAVPLSHYAFDIHIDTPFAGLGVESLAIVFQDYYLTPVWTALLWLIQALIVGLEWCYSIDLLDSHALGGLAGDFGATERAFTEPALVVVLAIAAVIAAYRGLIRRQVSQSLGDVAAMAAMMIAGLGLIAAPGETVGELSRMVNELSLGTMSAVSSGSPRHAEQSLADGVQGIFDSSVQGPWCYMEFGDVRWCRDRSRLDSALQRAARRLAAIDRVSSPCPASLPSGVRCAPGATSGQSERGREAAWVAGAQSNGALFLAFPANTPARNAISDPGSLLHTICRTYDATACAGPTAAQAEFRTAGGTLPRMGGLLFIGLGVLGMLALLGFIGLRLLGAAVLSVFLLLLAPIAVLAPGLGEAGRAAFRSWATRLLGALVAKLVYSVFLGAVLLMVRFLAGMGALGWWTQWLLVAVFWWTVFQHRHRWLEYATPAGREAATGSRRRAGRHGAAGRLGTLAAFSLLRSRRGGASGAGARIPGPGSTGPSRRPPARPLGTPAGSPDPGDHFARTVRADQAERLLAGQHREATRAIASVSAAEQDSDGGGEHPAGDRERLERLGREGQTARAAGDVRRATALRVRAEAVEAAMSAGEERLRRARALAAEGNARHAATGLVHGPADRAQAERFLDHQATLRRGVPPGPRVGARGYRDYGRLSWLAGVDSDEYKRLDPAPQRRVRLEIDRELGRTGPREPDGRGLPFVGRRRGPVGPYRPAGRAAIDRSPTASHHARQFLGGR